MVPLWHSEIDNGIIWHKLMAIWKITILTYCFGPCFFGPIKLYPHDPVNPTLCVVLITIQLLYVILFQSTRNNVFFYMYLSYIWRIIVLCGLEILLSVQSIALPVFCAYHIIFHVTEVLTELQNLISFDIYSNTL